jgi:hypothetical protein
VVTKQNVGKLLVAISLCAAGLVGCGGGSSSSKTPTPGVSGNNVQAIAVDGGPAPGQIYPNGAFTSVTVCAPGSSNCQTISGVLVDTGSFGLRLLGSALSLNLPKLTSGSNSLFNCVSFVDGSFLWGPVAQADVKMAGEAAGNVSIQVIEDPTGFSIPTACSNGGQDEDNLQALGANGIIGVGPEVEDCGPACAPGSGVTPPVYFSCSSAGNCSATSMTLAQQVLNPVSHFSSDNNGVIIQMQALSAPAATATGQMVFGIGTQSNNQLGSATVYTLNNFDNITTAYNKQTLNASFLDSGSNGFFFPDAAIPTCAANTIAPGFDCPASALNLSAQNVGANGAKGTVNFTVENAVTLFNSNNSDAAFPTLAGPNGSGTCSPQNTGACSFDWGLPFFYGRNVFNAIRGKTVPSGAPAAPWWAY